MPQSQVRVPGGGNTYVCIETTDKKIEFLANLRDQPGSIQGGPTPIQAIGDAYPREIVTGYSSGMGQLTLEVWQVWGKDGWVSAFQSTNGGENYIWGSADGSSLNPGNMTNGNAHGAPSTSGYEPIDIREVLALQRQQPESIKVMKVELGKDGNIARIKSYQNCVITGIDAGETVKNDTMPTTISITMNYTHFVVTKGADELTFREG